MPYDSWARLLGFIEKISLLLLLDLINLKKVSICYFFRSSTGQVSPGGGPGCQVERVSSLDKLIPYVKLLDLSLSTIRTRLERGDCCYLAYIEGRAVHRSWVTSTSCWVKDAKAIFKPQKGEVYVYDSYTLPRYRSRGAFSSTLLRILADYSGQSLVWIAVRNDNLPSRKAIEKAGFKKVFGLSYRRFFFFKHYEFLEIDRDFSEKKIKDRIIFT